MGLAEVQRALARIYTDTSLRERFLADPRGVGKELALSTDDIKQLQQVSTQQITLFAQSLHNKRLGEVQKLLPLSYKILGSTFNTLFHQFAHTYLPHGIKKHLDDGIQFASYLHNVVHTKHLKPDYLADVIHYEKCLLHIWQQQRRLVIARFHYHIETLLFSIEHNEQPDVKRRLTLVLWWKTRPGGQIYRRVLP